jgi:hypothetical protein
MHFGDIERLGAVDDRSPSTGVNTDPVPGDRVINAARRLRSNLRQGIVSERRSGLLTVVTFADGSQALQIHPAMAAEALVHALVRRALALAGPAIGVDEHGNVWRTYGSNELQASLATGIARVIDARLDGLFDRSRSAASFARNRPYH